MKQQKTIHGLSAKQRFFPLFDALVLGALLVGLMWIPENI